MKSRLYFNKNKTIIRFCLGKKVLDLGIVNDDVRYEKKKGWLHKDLRRVAEKIMGIDIDKQSIDILKRKGYNVKQGNVERFNLKEKFDVVVGGDIIEHLNNPGEFLESVKKHMIKNSQLIITTPNCLSLSNWIELFIFGKIKYFSEEHTHCYDEATIKRILENCGFEILELSFIVHNPHLIEESFLRYLLKNLRHAIHILSCLFRKQSAPTIFVRARLNQDNLKYNRKLK